STSALLPWSTWPAVPTTREVASVFLGGHAEDRLRGLVELGREGEARFLFRAHDERVVLPRHLDEEEELVPAQAQRDAAVLLVEGGFHQLVPEFQAGLLFVFRDEVVLLTGDFLQEHQLLGAEVEGNGAGFSHVWLLEGRNCMPSGASPERLYYGN